jgi:hypothetical protein
VRKSEAKSFGKHAGQGSSSISRREDSEGRGSWVAASLVKMSPESLDRPSRRSSTALLCRCGAAEEPRRKAER